MTLTDLGILIQQGEGTTVEFKEALSASFARELVALAKHRRGKNPAGVRRQAGTVQRRVLRPAGNAKPAAGMHARDHAAGDDRGPVTGHDPADHTTRERRG